MDEDDEYLYGSSGPTGEPMKQQRTPSGSPPVVTPVPQSATFDNISSTNGVVALLETEAESADAIVPGLSDLTDVVQAASVAVAAAQAQARAQVQEEEEEEEEEQVELGEESDEDDIEIIMEPQNRSLDFRSQNARSKPATGTVPLTSPIRATQPQGPTLTTEYTPMPRGGVPSTTQPPPPSTTAIQAPPPPQPVQTQHVSPLMEGSTEQQQQLVQQDGVDTSNLPPATAPPSHPSIDPAIPGMLDGRSILEVDVANMTEKPWRRPGSDISDWFNYGFDELTWEAYCYRRRELGEMANVLKANLINFTGMPEDQLSNLPPEVRQMVMTGMTALMNAGGPGPGMMGPGMMMDMSNMLGPMGMGMGMNGDMTMGNAMMQMQESAQQGVNVGVGATSTPEQVGSAVGMMQDGFSGAPGPNGMMNMGMGGEFAMQDQNAMNQQMYQNIDNSANVATPTPGPGPAIRGGTPVAPVSYRGRGAPTMPRGRGFPVRGRVPAVPRPASPLPPNVPTGPRNQNKYKDRDGNAPAVDGLDYGGGGGGGSVREGGRTPSGEPEERSSSRKRRSSPGVEDLRGPKRR
ncbi:hypothetical protein M378DRAFT_93920 [Amanita muscaria Koide BX008]|uniref:Pre-mRNA polyadenylation factor Fip1 domain-containing protein n=1 Tax=Amanita muscaria (strain Koide BX008) TaxID=946122 RepID=A0A0C2XQD1_AMAMK|nr:hypothetical protein M378DRAFT_93920 [Amanita muscaria Koide BX008]